MNKSEKLISAILGIILIVWMFNQSSEDRKAAQAAAKSAADAALSSEVAPAAADPSAATQV